MSGSIHIIKRSIRVILHTESASSTDRGHALPEADKTAIRRASKRATIVCAPRIILGFGPRSYSDSKNENPHYEYRYSHDCLLLAAVCRGRQNGVPNHAQADTPHGLLHTDIEIDYVRIMTDAQGSHQGRRGIFARDCLLQAEIGSTTTLNCALMPRCRM
jgi:hypothetical protein